TNHEFYLGKVSIVSILQNASWRGSHYPLESSPMQLSLALWRRLALFSLILTLSSCAEVAAPQRQALSGAAPTILSLKSEAEQWAHRIKANYNKGSQQYEGAYTKYIAAKAAFDAWLDRFSVDLTLGTDISSSDTYRSALRDAAEKGEDFIRFSK